MKWPATVSAIVAGMAFVAPAVSARPQGPRDRPIRALTLQIVASAASGVNGTFLSIQPSGEVGVYLSGEDPASAAVPAPAQFYVSSAHRTSGSTEPLYELHTYPIGMVDHALALNGTPGLLFLRDAANPAGVQTHGPGGYELDWQSFTLGGAGGMAGVGRRDVARSMAQARLANRLSYAGAKGRWILIQEGVHSYAAAWYGGTSIITQNYALVDIAYVEV